MDVEKEVKRIKEANLNILEVACEMDISNTKVEKVILKTNEFNITWKPKLTKPIFSGGMKLLLKDKPTPENLPNELKYLSALAMDKGKVKIKIDYNKMTTIEDNQTKEHRFLMGENPFIKMEVLENGQQENIVQN